MTDLSKLRLSLGKNPENWVNAIHESKTFRSHSGKVKVEIRLADGTLTRVSIPQLQSVAERFHENGSLEVDQALSRLKEQIRSEPPKMKKIIVRRFSSNQTRDDSHDTTPEPVPLASFAKHRKASSSQTFSDEAIGYLESSSEDIENNPQEALRDLIEEVFSHDRSEALYEFEDYSLKDQIVAITKGSSDINQLRKAVNVFEALIDQTKVSIWHRKHVQAAMNELKAKIHQFLK